MTSEIKTMLKDLFAGTVAGVAAKIVEHPFDVVKVRQQVEPGKGPLAVMRTGGDYNVIQGLYRGLTAPMAGAMAENAIVFLLYAKVKRSMAVLDSDYAARSAASAVPLDQPISHHAVAGFLSGIGVGLWLTPVELVKVRLQDRRLMGQYSSPLDCIRKTYAAEGMRGFFGATAPTLVRDTFGGCMYFTVYATACRLLRGENETHDSLAAWKLMAAGSASGCAYWSTILPIDMVKSRMQSGLIPRSYGMVASVAHVLRTERLSMLYAGWSMSMLRAVPSNAFIFLVYENIIRALKDV